MHAFLAHAIFNVFFFSSLFLVLFVYCLVLSCLSFGPQPRIWVYTQKKEEQLAAIRIFKTNKKHRSFKKSFYLFHSTFETMVANAHVMNCCFVRLLPISFSFAYSFFSVLLEHHHSKENKKRRRRRRKNCSIMVDLYARFVFGKWSGD